MANTIHVKQHVRPVYQYAKEHRNALNYLADYDASVGTVEVEIVLRGELKAHCTPRVYQIQKHLIQNVERGNEGI